MSKYLNKYFECFDKIHENNAGFCSLFYLLSVALFIVGYCIYKYINICTSYETVEFLKGIRKDLENTAIYDLSLSDGSYDAKYSWDYIDFLKWPGTDLGCRSTNKDKPEVTRGACTEFQKKLKWQSYYIYDTNFFTYRNKEILAKRERSRYYNSYINLIAPKNKNCPEGKKQCGLLDSLGNKLCLDKKDICPLNDIKINYNPEMENYKTLELNEGLYLHFTNTKTDKYIISDLSVFQSEPCFYSQEYKWDTFYRFEIGKDNNKGCSKKDERFHRLDSYNLSKFYEENIPLFYDPIIYLENKDLYYKSNITLFYRNYIGFNYNNITEKNIQEIYWTIYELIKLKEEERLFFSRISYIINNIILYLNGYTAVLISFIYIVFATLIKKYQCSYTKDIIIYILVPEVIFIVCVVVEFLKMKKQNKNANEILNNFYDAIDENTKFGFDKLIRNKYDITYLRNKPIVLIVIIFMLIAIIIAIIYLLKKLIELLGDFSFGSCDKEIQVTLVNNEEIKEITELKDIDNN